MRWGNSFAKNLPQSKMYRSSIQFSRDGSLARDSASLVHGSTSSKVLVRTDNQVCKIPEEQTRGVCGECPLGCHLSVGVTSSLGGRSVPAKSGVGEKGQEN